MTAAFVRKNRSETTLATHRCDVSPLSPLSASELPPKEEMNRSDRQSEGVGLSESCVRMLFIIVQSRMKEDVCASARPFPDHRALV